MKKYTFTGETKTLDNGVIVHRIRLLTDIGMEDDVGGYIKAGTIGGWIEKEDNLAHDSFGFVSDEAIVYGNAIVSGYVTDNAMVYGNARVYGYVTHNAIVCDNATIFARAWIKDNAMVYGNAKLNNVVVDGDTKVDFSTGVF